MPPIWNYLECDFFSPNTLKHLQQERRVSLLSETNTELINGTYTVQCTVQCTVYSVVYIHLHFTILKK